MKNNEIIKYNFTVGPNFTLNELQHNKDAVLWELSKHLMHQLEPGQPYVIRLSNWNKHFNYHSHIVGHEFYISLEIDKVETMHQRIVIPMYEHCNCHSQQKFDYHRKRWYDIIYEYMFR